MKQLLKPILRLYLKYITKLVLLIHRPRIIAISGSTNKSFFKSEIKKIISEKGLSVRANEKSYNTDIGLPLAILSIPSGYGSFRHWIPAIKMALLTIFSKKFPKYLVLELGVSHPGDMKYLLSIIKPDISVITEITQRYLESFSDMDDLVGEYEYMATRTKKGGLVVLNCDNERICSISKKIKNKKVLFFGRGKRADYNIGEIRKHESGQTVSIERNQEVKEYNMHTFGDHHGAALAAGLIIKEELSCNL